MGDAMELDQAAAVPVRRSTVGKALLPPHEHPGLLVVECNVRWREDRCDDIPNGRPPGTRNQSEYSVFNLHR